MVESDRRALRDTLLVVVLALVVAAVLTTLVSVPLPLGRGGMGGPGMGMGQRFETIGTLLRVKAFVASFNAVVLLALGWSYLRVYREVPSEFARSLLLVTVALFLYALASNPIVHVLLGYRGGVGLGPFTFLPDLFAAFAAVTLLYQSYR